MLSSTCFAKNILRVYRFSAQQLASHKGLLNPFEVSGTLKKKAPSVSIMNKKRKFREKKEELAQILNEQPQYVSELEDLEQAMVNPNTAEDLRLAEEDSRKRIKHAIQMKKYLKKDIEVSVLTWAAKEQIFHLYYMDPNQWTPETLSNVFPISMEGVAKLLKANRILHTREQVRQHDKLVIDRWITMVDHVQDDVALGFDWLGIQGKLHLLQFANGNHTLPQPTMSIIQLQEEKAANRTVGPFESLVSSYYATKCNKDNTNKKDALNQELDEMRKEIHEIIKAFSAVCTSHDNSIVQEDKSSSLILHNSKEISLSDSKISANVPSIHKMTDSQFLKEVKVQLSSSKPPHPGNTHKAFSMFESTRKSPPPAFSRMSKPYSERFVSPYSHSAETKQNTDNDRRLDTSSSSHPSYVKPIKLNDRVKLNFADSFVYKQNKENV